MDKDKMDIENKIYEPEGEDSKFVRNFRRNIQTDLILITQDKLENILKSHLDKAVIKREWILPFGIIIAIITTLCTAQFKDFLGFKGEIWKTLFIFVGFCMGYWFCKSIYLCFIYRKNNTLEYLVDKIRNVEEKTIIEEAVRNKKLELLREQIQEMQEKNKKMMGLIIIDAKYGKNGIYIDVNKSLNDKISDNKLNITVENKLFPIDPVKDVLKELIVTYSYDSQVKTITIPEHRLLQLPEMSEK